MRTTVLTALLASVIALPALAQVVPPAGPAAGVGTNAAIAHHDRQVARRAARSGHFHKAAVASHAANGAAADAAVAPR